MHSSEEMSKHVTWILFNFFIFRLLLGVVPKLLEVQFDLSYPASLYPDLSIIRTRSRREFFFCVYNNYEEKGDFKLNQNSYTNSHELHIIPNIINIHSHQIFF